MMAVWEVLLPTSVANPSTLRLSSCAVLDGVRSWLMMMHGSLRWRRSASSSRPSRLFSTRVVTSRMSVARSRRYSSSMADKRGGVAFGDRVEGVFRVDLLLLDHPHHLVEQRAVFEHQQMRVEDAAFLGAHAFAHLALHFQNLVPRLDQGLLQAIDLFGQVRVRQTAVARWSGGPAQHENLPAAYSGRNRYAPETLLSLVLGLWHGSILT